MTNSQKTKPVVKVSLTDAVPDFPVTITLALLNGDQAQLTLTCRHHRKTEWAAIRDSHSLADVQSKTKPKVSQTADQPVLEGEISAEEVEQKPFDLAAYFAENGVKKMVKEQLASGSALVMTFANGWDLAEPFNADNLAALEDKHGGAMRQMVAAYDVAIHQGRLGN